MVKLKTSEEEIAVILIVKGNDMRLVFDVG